MIQNDSVLSHAMSVIKVGYHQKGLAWHVLEIQSRRLTSVNYDNDKSRKETSCLACVGTGLYE